MPRGVRVCVAAWGALLLVWGLLIPPLQGNDEAAHVDMAVLLTHHAAWPDPGQRTIDQPLVTAAGSGYGVTAVRPGDVAVRALPWRVPLGTHEQASPIPDQQAQQPPTWYAVLAPVVWLGEQTGLSVGHLDLLLRLLGILCALPLPVLCWAAARRLLAMTGQPAAWAPLAAAVPLLVGGAARCLATVTNDTPLLLASAGCVLLLLLRYAASGARRHGVEAGLACGACVLLKGVAFALVPVVGVVGLLAVPVLSRRTRLTGAALATGAAVLASAPWWLRNLIELGTPQPRGLTAVQAAGSFAAGGPRLSLASAANTFTYDLGATLWNGQTPQWGQDITLIATLLGGIVVLSALLASRRHLRPVVVALAPAVSVVLFTAREALWHWQHYGGVSAAQGRYLLVGLAGAAPLSRSACTGSRAGPGCRRPG